MQVGSRKRQIYSGALTTEHAMVSLLIASTFILQPIQPTSLGAYREALSIIEAAAAKADRKAITVAHFRGTWDLATRLQ